MNKDKLQLFKSYRFLTVLVCIAVTLIVALLVFLNFDRIKAIILGDGYENSDKSGSGNLVPLMDAMSQSHEIYYTKELDDIFSTVNVSESYKRELRITTLYNGTSTTNTITLLKSGDRYAADSLSKKVIYADETLYIKTDLYSFSTAADAEGMYAELGLTSLDSVIEVAGLDDSTVTLSDDGKTVTVYYMESDASKQSEYVVSIETGIVVSETHYHNGQIVRAVTTDLVDVIIGEEIPSEYFNIPS